jgi:hypothetical protein
MSQENVEAVRRTNEPLQGIDVDGQVARFEDFMDRRKAFEAVGLSDAAYAEMPIAARASVSSA